MNTENDVQVDAFHQVTTFRSLWTQVMSMMGVMALAALVFSSAGVMLYTNSAERATWKGRQGEAVKAAADVVTAFLENTRATLVWIDILGEDEFREKPDILRQVLEINPTLLEIVCLDADGQVTSSAALDSAVLANLITIRQSRWFLEAKSGSLHQSRIQLTEEGQPYLILSQPANEGGVIAARVSMDILWRLIDEIQVGEHSLSYVVNERGYLLAHSNRELVLQVTSLAGRPELLQALQSPDGTWFGSFVNIEGVPVVGTSYRIPNSNWLVFVELPQSEAYILTKRALWVLVGGTFVFLVVANFIAAAYLRKTILRPMFRLYQGVVRIGKGDLSYRIALAGRNEISQVAEAFDDMAQKLQNREEQLLAQSQNLAEEIEERKGIETALRASEERYRGIVKDQTELICRWLPDGTLTFVNEAYCRYFGKTYAELVGHSFVPLIPPEDQEVVSEVVTTPDPENPIVSAEHSVISADGSLRWQQWTDRAIFDASGNVVEFQSVGRDITEKRLAEIALKELNASLEERIAERTVELSRVAEELRWEVDERMRAEAQLQASLREKEVLLREIHHRVKNNLQIVSSLLSLQARQVTDATGLAMLQDSQNRLRSMALIHEKLHQSVEIARVDFGDYIRSLIASLMASYSGATASVSVVIEVAPDIHLDIDTAVPCGLIINELISNALKHAFADGRSGTLWTSVNRTANQELELVVRDNGVGLPPDMQSLTTKSLGLRLVNTLVRQIKGTLEMNNVEGAMFRVVFPYTYAGEP
ncbi:MAG: putative sensor histidine kinase pdtaS [Chloroflexi bacterium ADurb.Bin360]|nr:MAG: putative sensor histidine kinase pdtaS [Chloroflexi bacterium ADurb.Bin360]